MANEYDKIFRENIEELLPFLAATLLGIDSSQWEELPDDVQVTLERKPDFLKKVNHEDEPYLLHIEFQVKHDAEMPYRMHEYYAFLLRKYRLPVKQFVLQIARPVSIRSARLSTDVLRFRYQLINLRDLDYQLFLSSEKPEEVLLAVLANFRGTEPRKVLQWLLQKLSELTRRPGVEPGSHRFEKYANQLLILAKLRNLEEEAFKLLETVPISLGINIEDLYSFKQGEQRGEQQGVKQGEKQGERKARNEVILNLYQLNQLTLEQIAQVVDESVDYVRQVIASCQS